VRLVRRGCRAIAGSAVRWSTLKAYKTSNSLACAFPAASASAATASIDFIVFFIVFDLLWREKIYLCIEWLNVMA
jgi:hypothetical protein